MLSNKSRNKSQQSFYPVQSSTTFLKHLDLSSLARNNSSIKPKQPTSLNGLAKPTLTSRRPGNEIANPTLKKSFRLFKRTRRNLLSPSKTISSKERSWSSKSSSLLSVKRKPILQDKSISHKLSLKFIRDAQLRFESTFYFKNFNHAKKKIMNDFVEKVNSHNILSSKRNYEEYLVYLDNNKEAQSNKVKRIEKEFNRIKRGFESLGDINRPFIQPKKKLPMGLKIFTNDSLKCSNKVYLNRAYKHFKRRKIEEMTKQVTNEIIGIESNEYQALNQFTMKSNSQTVNTDNLNRQVKLLSILANHYDYDKDVLLEHDFERFRNEMNEIDFEKYKTIKDVKPSFLKKVFKKQTMTKFKYASGKFFSCPGKPIQTQVTKYLMSINNPY